MNQQEFENRAKDLLERLPESFRKPLFTEVRELAVDPEDVLEILDRFVTALYTPCKELYQEKCELESELRILASDLGESGA